MLWYPALPEFRTARCRATARSVRPGAALIVVEGVADAAYQAWLRDVLGRLVATHGTVELFVDARRVRAYEPSVREEEAELVLSFGDRLPAVHVLVRSRLQAFGLLVADLALTGSVRAYAAFSKFRAALCPETLPVAPGF
jgi:hypothetical protein